MSARQLVCGERTGPILREKCRNLARLEGGSAKLLLQKRDHNDLGHGLATTGLPWHFRSSDFGTLQWLDDDWSLLAGR